jgi:DNA-binding NtrC family response regulator
MRHTAESETSTRMTQQPPDIVFLDADWQSRALIRAQLMEEGFEVVATESWTMMRRHLRPGSKPRLAIVDLKDLPEPQEVLRDLRVLMKPERVLVLSAIGTIPREDIERHGFHIMPRPFVIEDLVREVRTIMQARSG